jgi:ketosteroid isomerase-like protein
MNADEQRQRNLEGVKRSFAAVSEGDVAGQLEGFTDDAVLELPYADPPVRLEGKAAIRDHLEPALRIFQFRLDITEVYESVDPDLLILEYKSEGKVTTTGKAYSNTYIGVVRFRDGKVCFQREFYNPVPAARSLQPD